jgi:hypothetical protein
LFRALAISLLSLSHSFSALVVNLSSANYYRKLSNLPQAEIIPNMSKNRLLIIFGYLRQFSAVNILIYDNHLI